MNLSCGNLNLADQPRTDNNPSFDPKKNDRSRPQITGMQNQIDNFRKRYIPKVGE